MSPYSISSNNILSLFFGVFVVFAGAGLIRLILKLVFVVVEEENVALIQINGKISETKLENGLHFVPSKILPWVHVIPVSLKRDYRLFKEIHMNDSKGTTVVVDLWLEFNIKDPVKALYTVENWENVLKNHVEHTASSILGTYDFKKLLCERNELNRELREAVAKDAIRWGIHVNGIFIHKTALLPDVSRQMFDSVAARLERTKAQIDETGRIDRSLLEAKTSEQIAKLVAAAKGQYPLAIARAFENLKKEPNVLAAYKKLHSLSLVRPHRTVYFEGFGPDEIRRADAAMMPLALEATTTGTGAIQKSKSYQE